ncbi:MAG: malto-oligosyltrehalose trehalohydrolase [Thermoleophilia bacterium]|nr:malto-oligosyltrehalose trehalohydrolase [Thermoleophilia bacterium]
MSDRLGAVPSDDGSCTFTVWAPHAQRVRIVLRGVAADEAARTIDMEAGPRGYYRARVDDVAAGARYAYLLDGDPLELPDPASAAQPDGVHGASEVVDHSAFEWTDAQWRGRPLAEYVIYELHVGTFTEAGTFDAVIDRLDELAADGITAIELLPVAEFPGGRNWGYDGVDLFAAQSTYGGPEGLRRLVDAAHARGLAIVLDVVYNHVGPEGNYLDRFGPYMSVLHGTPWGAAMNVDGAGSDEVRRCFIENALMWLRDFHVDALRLDAVHAIVDMSATPFLAELADAVELLAQQTERGRWLIAESDLNDVRTITPRVDGGTGLHAQWADDFHHALHVAVTGEREGYYADFSGVDDLARSLRDGFVYTGQYSQHRARRHGVSAAGVGGDRLVVYAQNHDQVGNRLVGDRLATTLGPDDLRLVAAVVLLAPFVPMLFMGEEYGERRPFPYFISHGDPALIEAVRAGRAREFAHAGGDVDQAIDPQDPATFRSAVLDWDARGTERGEQLLAFHRALLHLRRAAPSIAHLDPAAGIVRQVGSRCLTLERAWEGDHTLVAWNFDEHAAALTDLLPDGLSEWERVVDSQDVRFGGSGIDESGIGARAAAVFRKTSDHVTGARR